MSGQIRKLGDVAIRKGLQTGPFGSQLKAEEYVTPSASSVPVVMPTDIDGDSALISSQKIKHTSETKAKALWRHRLQAGDIIFPRRGDLHKVAIVKQEQAGWLCGSGCLRARLNPSHVNFEYIGFFVQQNSVKQWLTQNSVGQTMLNLNSEIIANLPVALPVLAEQKRIAEILSTANFVIAKTESKLDLMLRQLNGVRKSLISNSGSGKQIKLGDICQPKQWKTITKEELTSSGYPVFGANAYVGFYHTYNHKAETIAVSCRGSCGEVSMIPGPSYITGNSMCLDNLDTHQVIQDYLFHCLKVADLKKIISGSAQPQIILSDLEMFPIKIPDMSYQKKVSAALGDSMSSIETQKNLIAALKKQKRGLMQQLLTGKTRVLPKNNKGGTK